MKRMTADEIRESFLKFFESKMHKRLPSASLIPNDPQLLFTVAGMVPFKPIFWGKVEPTFPRVTTCQKCIRTNDIENVGRTPRHHTFFEMLGNFSFGDYFKHEAIDFAWEFLTKELEIPADRLWPSVYLDDEESFNIWKDKIGIPEKRIMRFDKSENWWGPAGPTGPCGPCSEIYIDTLKKDKCNDPDNCSPACECGRFVEIWNIVFTEYYADENGNFTPLARKNIDTGAGLERISAAMQGVYHNFDSDLFTPIIRKIEEIFNVKYNTNDKTDVSIRVIADHARTVNFLVSDGVLPANDGRGYVLRRVLRRGLRHGNLLGKNEPFMEEIINVVVDRYGHVYPELIEKKDFVKKIVLSEEKRFFQTLQKGLEKVEALMAASTDKVISGKDAFELFDTYGFPKDITVEIAEEKGFTVDLEGFETLMEQQQERARAAAGNKEFDKANMAYKIVGDELKKTEFVGYEKTTDEAEVLYIVNGSDIIDEALAGQTVEVILNKTPFYAEKGGQVADEGIIQSGDNLAVVTDVKIIHNDVIGHKVTVESGKITKGMKVKAVVSDELRDSIRRNHTATHLLHTALRRVAGDHIKQAGSLVETTRLRFDFTHYEGLTKEQLKEIERVVNNEIIKAIPVITEVKTLEQAKNEKVIALFDEKYGNEVRVVKVGEFSAELCGGTHVRNTGEIGLFKIISETSVSAGIRRIEALTGMNSWEYLARVSETLDNTSKVLDAASGNIVEKAEGLVSKIKDAEKEIKRLESKLAVSSLDNFLNNAVDFEGKKVVTAVMEDLDQDTLRNTADILLQKAGSGVVILFNKGEKVNFAVKVSKDAMDKFHAGNIAKKVAAKLGGGGGGRPDFAMAGGKDPNAIPEIIKNISEYIK